MSRPTRVEQASVCSLRVRVTRVERRDLEDVARENKVCMADLIREAVNEYVGDYRDRVPFRRTQSRH
jgi:hypothetical protein